MSVEAILTSWRKRMVGQVWRWRKARRDAGGMLALGSLGFDAGKKDVIDFWRNGVMPLMFHENMRILFAPNGGRGSGGVAI